MPSPTQARLLWRTLSRSMVEPHPFARNPITMTPHAWRAGDLSRKLVKTSAVYVSSISSPTILLVGNLSLMVIQLLPVLCSHFRLASRCIVVVQWEYVTLLC